MFGLGLGLGVAVVVGRERGAVGDGRERVGVAVGVALLEPSLSRQLLLLILLLLFGLLLGILVLLLVLAVFVHLLLPVFGVRAIDGVVCELRRLRGLGHRVSVLEGPTDRRHVVGRTRPLESPRNGQRL